LCEAALRACTGRIDADLGGGVVKQRVARRGQGKSVGFRAVILYRRGSNAYFVYGFAKNDRDNIRADELRAFRKLAGHLLALDPAMVDAALRNGTLKEIDCHG
jgi:hypothetical protein